MQQQQQKRVMRMKRNKEGFSDTKNIYTSEKNGCKYRKKNIIPKHAKKLYPRSNVYIYKKPALHINRKKTNSDYPFLKKKGVGGRVRLSLYFVM